MKIFLFFSQKILNFYKKKTDLRLYGSNGKEGNCRNLSVFKKEMARYLFNFQRLPL